LGAANFAEVDKTNVVLCPDGTVAAVNRWGVYVAEPCKQRDTVVGSSSGADLNHGREVSVHYMTVREVCKNMIKGEPEYINIRGVCPVLATKFGEYRSIPVVEKWREKVSEIVGSGDGVFRDFELNRKRLKTAVETVEISCKYDGEFAFISQRFCTKGLVWKAENELYNQKILIAFELPSGGVFGNGDPFFDKFLSVRPKLVLQKCRN